MVFIEFNIFCRYCHHCASVWILMGFWNYKRITNAMQTPNERKSISRLLSSMRNIENAITFSIYAILLSNKRCSYSALIMEFSIYRIWKLLTKFLRMWKWHNYFGTKHDTRYLIFDRNLIARVCWIVFQITIFCVMFYVNKNLYREMFAGFHRKIPNDEMEWMELMEWPLQSLSLSQFSSGRLIISCPVHPLGYIMRSSRNTKHGFSSTWKSWIWGCLINVWLRIYIHMA